MTFNELNNELLNNIRTSNQQAFSTLTPEDVAFYEAVSNGVTGTNSLPFDLPAPAVFILITRALKFFWEWYDQGVEERTLLLPYSEIVKAKGSRLNKQVKLPNGIEALSNWEAVEGSGISGSSISQYIDYAILQNFNTGATFSNGATGGSRDAYRSNNVSIVNVVTSLYEVEAWKNLFQRTIRASFNKHSQIFSIQSSVETDIILHCFVRLQPEYMYTYQLFEDYVCACVEEQLGKILSMFDFKYPGGVQPNFDKIHESGSSEKTRIEEYLREANTAVAIF